MVEHDAGHQIHVYPMNQICVVAISLLRFSFKGDLEEERRGEPSLDRRTRRRTHRPHASEFAWLRVNLQHHSQEEKSVIGECFETPCLVSFHSEATTGCILL